MEKLLTTREFMKCVCVCLSFLKRFKLELESIRTFWTGYRFDSSVFDEFVEHLNEVKWDGINAVHAENGSLVHMK